MLRYLFVFLFLASPAMAADVKGDVSDIVFKSATSKADEYRSYIHIKLLNSVGGLDSCEEYIWRRNTTIPKSYRGLGSKLAKSTVVLNNVKKDDISNECYFEGYEITETRSKMNVKPVGKKQAFLDKKKKNAQGDELIGNVNGIYMHRVRDVFIFHVDNNDRFRNLCREGQVHADEKALNGGIPDKLDPYMKVNIENVFFKLDEALSFREQKCYFSVVRVE